MNGIPQVLMALGGSIASAWEAATNKIIAELRTTFGAMGPKNSSQFWYQFSAGGQNGFVDLGAAGVIVPANFRVNEDADFVAVRWLQATIDSAAGTLVDPPNWTIEFLNSGSDRNWQNFPVHARQVAGDSRESIPYPMTQLFPKSALISANFRSLDGAANRRVFLAAYGFKVYNQAQLDAMYRR